MGIVILQAGLGGAKKTTPKNPMMKKITAGMKPSNPATTMAKKYMKFGK